MKEGFRVAGLIIGMQSHYLDHLAPLCSILDIPLIVTDKRIEQLAREFYRDLHVIWHESDELCTAVADGYDLIIHSAARPLFDDFFFLAQKLRNKKIHTLWCPHGNSDKGHAVPFMEGLKDELAALVYGKKMLDFLECKGVLEHLKGYGVVGNYRLAYFEHHKVFYRNLTQAKLMKKLPAHKKNILYAPTWDDAERSSSCFSMLPMLAERLVDEFNLIIKLHPNTYLQKPFLVDKLMEELHEKERVVFVEDFPPIYPLIDIIDIYIGDASSIGYDVAALNKAMFLLNQNERCPMSDPGMYLFRCGTEVTQRQYRDIYKIITAFLPSDSMHFAKMRKEVSQYTFGEKKTFEEIRDVVEKLYPLFPETDLNFY